MFRARYHLNPETLLFEKVRIPLRTKVRNGILGFMVLTAFAAGSRLLLDEHFDSPRIKYFTEKNKEMKASYTDLNESISASRRDTFRHPDAG